MQLLQYGDCSGTLNNFKMWKFPVFLLALCFTAVTTQDVTVTCDFQLNADFGLYSCNLESITVLDPSVNVVFNGVHIDNRTNEDVTIMYILNSTTPFIIQQMFTTFPNLVNLTITRSGLETVRIPESAQLEWINFNNNNITRLDANSFRNQTTLTICYLQYNRIAEIDENTFSGLENLQTLDFEGNSISELGPKIFSSLSDVFYINFMRNFVTRIDAELFSRNSNLRYLDMSHNRINKIAPQFADSFRETADYINLLSNICVDRFFSPSVEDRWNEMLRELQTCFNNFNNGTDTDTRRIMMEFTGPLTIYDENGNVLAKV